jgi:exonuclease III
MINFLFWNLKNKRLEPIIAKLALKYEVDILMFAECIIIPDELVSILNKSTGNIYYYALSPGCEKIKIFTRFSDRFIPAVREWDRLTIRHLKFPGATDILLSVIHSPSKNHSNERDQARECSWLSQAIRDEEKKAGHSRSVLVGDLNMSPFEIGVISADGLHGVLSRRIAQRKTRIVKREAYPFFYNPMWNLLGDANSEPPGTYYYTRAGYDNLFWYMLDQVLIRPDLLDNFNNQDLKIITSDGDKSFLTANGIPDKRTVSDHLPIFFRLNL